MNTLMTDAIMLVGILSAFNICIQLITRTINKSIEDEEFRNRIFECNKRVKEAWHKVIRK